MKGGALPTRGVSSYRKLRKPGAGARVARFCPFSCFHCGGRALGAPRPARTTLPLARSVSLDSGEYRRVARQSRALGESPARMTTLPLTGVRFVEFGDD